MALAIADPWAPASSCLHSLATPVTIAGDATPLWEDVTDREGLLRVFFIFSRNASFSGATRALLLRQPVRRRVAVRPGAQRAAAAYAVSVRRASRAALRG